MSVKPKTTNKATTSHELVDLLIKARYEADSIGRSYYPPWNQVPKKRKAGARKWIVVVLEAAALRLALKL